MTSKVEDYTKNVLKVVVAQVCQIIGWNSIHQSSLEVLVDTLDRFLQELTKQTSRITELYQRTEPTLDDLALAFHYLNVNLSDIKEYIDYVGPPENVVAIPKYPAPPPEILNVKRQYAIGEDFAEPGTSTDLPVQPKAEDSEDEAQFQGFFQYNREYKTEITGEGGLDVKREDNASGDANKSSDDLRTTGNPQDSKQDLKKMTANRAPIKRKITTVQLTPTGRIQGVREGRLPGADLPAMFLSEIEAASNYGVEPSVEQKPSKSKSHKHQEPSGSGSTAGGSNVPSSNAPPLSTSSAYKREKLSQEPDRVKANIFKKISQPHKSSPTRPTSAAAEVIDIDSSPNHASALSPIPKSLSATSRSSTPSSSSVKREKKEKRKKDKEKSRDSHSAAGPSQSAHLHLGQQLQPAQFLDNQSILSNIPPLPAGTTLEAIPMKRERVEPVPMTPLQDVAARMTTLGAPPNMPFNPATFFPSGPNFSLPQAPGLIPFGPNVPNLLIPPVLGALAAAGGNRMPLFSQLSPQMSPDSTALISPKRREKEAKKQKVQQSSLCNVAPLVPPNLFLPDTTVRVETVVKPEPVNPLPVVQQQAAPPPVVGSGSPIDLVTDEENDAATAAAQAAAAKKAEKQKKKEQRRLEKEKAAAIGASGSGGVEKSQEGPEGGTAASGSEKKKDKSSKTDRKLEKSLLKKMMKKFQMGADGGGVAGAAGQSDQPIDLSMLDQDKQRKLEKKLKKLQKSNKAKMKAEQEAKAAAAAAAAAALAQNKSPEVQALPKLTLKLNSPKVAEMLHSPKEFVGSEGGGGRERPHGSKEYRPLTVDTSSGELMTPVKRIKAEALNSPGGSGVGMMHVEPELAKISPLIKRPMKQQQGDSGTPPVARGRPKLSSIKSHSGAGAVPPPVIPVKTVEENVGSGNQVWICPACGSVDDGSPMIGCDGCDNWYHWLCVGIQVAPESSEDWFCRVCLMQRKEMMSNDGLSLDELAARKKEKKRKKKEKRAMRMEGGGAGGGSP